VPDVKHGSVMPAGPEQAGRTRPGAHDAGRKRERHRSPWGGRRRRRRL